MADCGFDFLELAKCFNRTFARTTYHLGDENTALLDGDWYLIDTEDYDALRPVFDFKRKTVVEWKDGHGNDCSIETKGRLVEYAHAELDGKHYIQIYDPNDIKELRAFIETELVVMEDG